MQPQKENFFAELVKYGLIALLIVVPIRFYIAQPFIVSGASMEPTFENGEYLVVDQLTYNALGEPKRGDVIIFKYPKDPSKYFIKRIIGLPGETLEMKGGAIIIYNESHPAGIVLEEPYLDDEQTYSYRTETVELADDEYFVMGDNRNASSDSRTWGPLKESAITGRAYIRLLPLSHTDFLPGNVNPASIL